MMPLPFFVMLTRSAGHAGNKNVSVPTDECVLGRTAGIASNVGGTDVKALLRFLGIECYSNMTT